MENFVLFIIFVIYRVKILSRCYEKGDMHMKRFMYNSMKTICSLALAFAVLNVNAACYCICYQPEVPEQLKKYKK